MPGVKFSARVQAAIAGLILTPAATAGQTMSQSAAVRQPAAIDEIIVTATKRETPLRITPLSITAISGDRLDELGQRDFNDYFREVPGLTTVDNGPGRKTYILRGISGQSSGRSQAVVAQYVDEVPITNSFGQQPDPRLVDVDRIEVLRGPQGTLFGARAMAGTIRTITRKPVIGRFEGNATANISNTRFGGWNGSVEGVLNVPLNDSAAFRVSAFYNAEDGYVDNVFPGGTFVATPAQLPPGVPVPPPITLAPKTELNYSDVTYYGGRMAVRWEAADRLTVDITAQGQQGDVVPPTYQVGATGTGARGLITSVIGKNGNQDSLLLGTGTLTYTFDAATVTAVGAYSRRDNMVVDAALDVGVFAATGPGTTSNFGGTTTSRTFEVRAVSTGAGRFQWLAGAYAFHQSQFTVARGFLGFANIIQMEILSDGISAELAGFGETSYEVLPGLKAIAGLRYSKYRNQLNQDFIVPPPGGMIPPGPYPNPPRFEEESTTPKFSISYQAAPDLFTYATVSQGFRPGGFNAAGVQGIPDVPPYFKNDYLWNYEVGAKAALFDHHLDLDASVFRLDWDRIQTDTRPVNLLPGQPRMGYTTNAGSARVVGAELEAHARISPELSLDLALSHFFQSDLTADALLSPSGLTAKAGDRLPNNADTSFNLGADYRTDLTDSLRGFAHADWSYTGARTTGYRPLLDDGRPNNAYNDFRSYSLVNLRAGIDTGAWRTSLYVNNVGDARPVLQQGNFAPAPVTTRVTARPRTFGLTVQVFY